MDNELDINEVMASGDPDLMDQYLKQVSEQDEAEDADVSEEADVDEASATSGVEMEAGAEPVIKSKSGREEIPYSVLQSEREQNRLLREQIEQLTSTHAGVQQQIGHVKAQLERRGLDVGEMFRDPDEIDDQQWQELIDDYGSAGRLLKRLHEQNQQLTAAIGTQGKATQQPQVSAEEQVRGALESTRELKGWATGSPEKWSVALQLDEQLKTSDQWRDKPMVERFLEIERQVNARFASQAKQRAQSKIDESDLDSFPDSLSDMGQPPAIGKTRIEQFSSMSPDQLQDAMSRMSPTEIDQLLNSL